MWLYKDLNALHCLVTFLFFLLFIIFFLGKMIDEPTNNTLQFESLDGTKFTSFAKTNSFGKDLYTELVAPSLQVDLLTETWQNGQGDLGSFCEGKYTVEDISEINIAFPGGTKYSFHNSNDHSKFAISKTADRPFVCIGDINRQVYKLFFLIAFFFLL